MWRTTLNSIGQWRSHLHDLGECEVKHDVRVHVVNLYTDELGNRELPEKFQQAKATLTAPPTSAPVAKPAPRSRGLIAALIIVAALAAAADFTFFSHRPRPDRAAFCKRTDASSSGNSRKVDCGAPI